MRWFRRPPPTPSEAGRILSEMACLNDRERIRARARLMCIQQGKPIPDILQPRTKG